MGSTPPHPPAPHRTLLHLTAPSCAPLHPHAPLLQPLHHPPAPTCTPLCPAAPHHTPLHCPAPHRRGSSPSPPTPAALCQRRTVGWPPCKGRRVLSRGHPSAQHPDGHGAGSCTFPNRCTPQALSWGGVGQDRALLWQRRCWGVPSACGAAPLTAGSPQHHPHRPTPGDGLQRDSTASRFQPRQHGVGREAVPCRRASRSQPCALCSAPCTRRWHPGSCRHLQGSPRASQAGLASLGRACGTPQHAARLAWHQLCQPAPGAPCSWGCASWSVSLLLVQHLVPARGRGDAWWMDGTTTRGLLGGWRGQWWRGAASHLSAFPPQGRRRELRRQEDKGTIYSFRADVSVAAPRAGSCAVLCCAFYAQRL